MIAVSWRRLEAWAQAHLNPPPKFRNGTSVEAISAVEKSLGLRLPADLWASLMLHDGEESSGSRWLPEGCRLLSTSEIVEHWAHELESENEADPEPATSSQGKLQPLAFSHRRVPFALGENGVCLFVDYLHGPTGTPGQVIFRAQRRLVVMRDSFREFFDTYVALLEHSDGVERHFNQALLRE